MSRARICIDYDDRVEAIHCENNSLLSQLGNKLYYHYNNEKLVKDLIKLGDIRIIDKTIKLTERQQYGTKFEIYKKPEEYCVHDLIYYLRNSIRNFNLYVESHNSDFMYMWKNNSWYYLHMKTKLVFCKLDQNLVGSPQ